MRLERVAIAGSFDGASFPTIAIVETDVAVLGAEAWRADAFDFWAFDREIDAIADAGGTLSVDGAIAGEVLTRAQRRIERRNAATAQPWFDRLLADHRAMHDLAKPLVRADFDHALDAWQWVLRLDGDAPVTVQLATLLHDIERLASEADARIEHHAADYQAFKDVHARDGARIAAGLLARAGIEHAIVAEVARLIAEHERPGADRARQLVTDADALSFFSLNSAGYLAYFGREQTAKKVAYTLARMSPAARAELPRLRVCSEVGRMLRGHRDL